MKIPHYRFSIILNTIGLCILYSCSNPKVADKVEAITLKIDTAFAFEPTIEIKDSAALTAVYDLEHLRNPAAFHKCQLFDKADTNAKAIGTVEAYAPLQIQAKEEFEWIDSILLDNNQYATSNNVRYWYKVKGSGGQRGFIKEEDVAKYVFYDEVKGVKYFIGHPKSSKRKEMPTVTRIVRYDINNHKITDILEDDYYGESRIQVNLIKNMPLKGMQTFLRITTTQPYCGGGEFYQFIADVSGKLIAFPHSHFSNTEDGSEDYDDLYFPFRMKNGLIRLVKNAIPEQDTMPVPTSLKFPTENLVVKVAVRGVSALDKNDEPIVDKDGKIKMMSFKRSVSYYEWNNNRLNKVKIP